MHTNRVSEKNANGKSSLLSTNSHPAATLVLISGFLPVTRNLLINNIQIRNTYCNIIHISDRGDLVEYPEENQSVLPR